jgi:hypothetical protein
LEVVPLIVDRQIVSNDEQIVEHMRSDYAAPAQIVIDNADRLLTSLDENLEHLVTFTSNSTSLSLVPLFYWYNHKGQYARGLLYGFLYWLLSGYKQEVSDRKLIFSGNRNRFEHILFYLKPEIAAIQARGGAGLKATKRAAQFFQAFLQFLHGNPSIEAGSEVLDTEVINMLTEYANIPRRKGTSKFSRSFSTTDKSQINIRELFENSVKCHICGGVVNLQYGSIQYDHKVDYSIAKVTDPETGKPTHPFCNRYKQEILSYRSGKTTLQLPAFSSGEEKQRISPRQLNIFDFLGDRNFPT